MISERGMRDMRDSEMAKEGKEGETQREIGMGIYRETRRPCEGEKRDYMRREAGTIDRERGREREGHTHTDRERENIFQLSNTYSPY